MLFDQVITRHPRRLLFVGTTEETKEWIATRVDSLQLTALVVEGKTGQVKSIRGYLSRW